MIECVYILASRRNGTLYTGVTADIARRAFEHRTGAIRGFTSQYGVRTPVFIEFHETMDAALQREKLIKRWRRAWKLALAARMEARFDRARKPAVARSL